MKSPDELDCDRMVLIGQMVVCAERQDWKRVESLLKSHDEQIQLDAMKEGMTMAAEIVAPGFRGNPGSRVWSTDMSIANERAILAARDAITTLPKEPK